jgi:hypothetical protein
MKKAGIAKAGMLIAAMLTALASAAGAQLVPALPPVGVALPSIRPLTDAVTQLPDRAARALEVARLDRVGDLLRANPDRIALDPGGFPARAHEVVASDPDDALVAAAEARGYRLIERGDLLGIGFARFETPAGRSLKAAIRELGKLGAKEVSADQLHFESGAASGAAPPDSGAGIRIGMIDGGVAGDGATQRGFAAGAPRASDHGTAVASLIAGSAGVRAALPGAKLLAADVYGADPAGGNATAIAKALGWLAGERVPVVSISLVGPANPLLARVVAAAQVRGMIIVAAVGNDGAASPPSYPASYPGVIAVTGVDGRNRVLIEAGRATHLDYAAPAADMLAAIARGGVAPVRGTSFAVPLVAATIARAYPTPDPARRAGALARVDAGVERLGRKYGRGLVCAACRTPVK